MKLTFTQHTPGLADGLYQIHAEGIAASLHWADAQGILKNWKPIAFLPISPEADGCLCMMGGRAIPAGATHLTARTISEDFSHNETLSVPIPLPSVPEETPRHRFLVLTDLHLSKKPGVVRRALDAGKNYDAVLITGDMTNDGTPEQLTAFWNLVNETLPGIPVFAVAGNHDYHHLPAPHIFYDICEYHVLQSRLLDRAEALGWEIVRDESGAYAARKENVEILGLNAVWHWRRFKFPHRLQLDWLENHLAAPFSGQRILLCHAPLQRHRPCKDVDDVPYLSMDQKLQQILDRHRGLLFLSGHTHISWNLPAGCLDRDGNGNFYFNGGSIRPTTLISDEPLRSRQGTEGCGLCLSLTEQEIRLEGFSLRDGSRFPRAYYRIPAKKEENP